METLAWYIAGPLIGLMVPLLLYFREEQLGLSSSYRYLGSFILPKNSYFNYGRTSDVWQVHFGLGIVVAALVIFQFDLYEIGAVGKIGGSVPEVDNIYQIQYWFLFLVGGIFVGFGARYAGGCTAGHCIMGNSIFSKASFISTCMFFIGGLIVTHFILPYII